MKRSIIHAIAHGAALGAVAGAFTASGDFGAQWHWLDRGSDQAWFLLRLLWLQIPLGAWIGAFVLALGAAIDTGVQAWEGRTKPGIGPRRHRLHIAVTMAVIALPATLALGHALFSGGQMSRLAARPLWEAAVDGILVVSLTVGAFLLLQLLAWLRVASRSAAARVAVASIVAAILLTKLDQHVLPKLYEYLHSCLALGAFSTFMLAAHATSLAIRSRLLLAANSTAFGLLGVSAAALWVNLATLDANQNVRVAMQSPRASVSRSVLRSAHPLLRGPLAGRLDEAARRAAQRAERRSLRARNADDSTTRATSHILLITIDALRADRLGLYGYDRNVSPHLDRFAEDAVVFERAYAQAPHSSYSLCSLMSSEYLHETLDLGQQPPRSTLASAIASRGDHTAAFYTRGIFHTAGERLRVYDENAFGFELHEHRNRDAEATTDRVLQEIDRIVRRGEPNTLLWAHYFDVHEPYRETALGTSDSDRYDGEIRNVDRAVGRLLREARARLEREPIVVVTADHGEEFREHGGVYHGSTLYDEQIRVPLLVHIPNTEPRRIQAPVELVDVAPTLLRLVDATVPDTMRGDDLRPLMSGAIDDMGPAFGAVAQKRMAVRWPHKLIADLRFGLYELYDLEQDPGEHRNLADDEPELRRSLRGEIYAWLDALRTSPVARAEADTPLALDRGRLGDRRAVQPLADLLLDETAPLEQRIEAARILAKLTDRRSADELRAAMSSPHRRVAAEAAVALGRQRDSRAETMLRDLVQSSDPDLRTRAAISLARLRNREAVPALAETLRRDDATRFERKEAVRWLGRLGDPRGLEPLLEILPESRLRYLTVIALGQLGDARAFEPLVDVLTWDDSPNIRDNVARGLGLLGDPRGVSHVLDLAVTEPTLENPTESLVRLDAIDRGVIGGSDVREGTGRLRGFQACQTDAPDHEWHYLHRTWCHTAGQHAEVKLRRPSADASTDTAYAWEVVVSLRRLDAEKPTAVQIRVGNDTMRPLTIDGTWQQARRTLESPLPDDRPIWAKLEAEAPDARLAVDHVLLLPKRARVAER